MKKLLSMLAGVWLAQTGCTVVSHEPRNIDQLKAEIRTYISSGDYEREVAAITVEAKAWVETRAARRKANEKLTMVLDLDETLLSNWPFILDQDIGGSDAAWDMWLSAGKDPAIEPVGKIYHIARRLGVEVVFITSRHEHLRAATEKNLRAIDCADYAALIMKPEGAKESAALFKTEQRRRLIAEGRVIIANIGDQESDLAGGFAERTFKLPDPFYLTP